MSPLTVPMLMPNGPAAHVGIDLKARAGVHSPASACASGAEAIAWVEDDPRRAGRRHGAGGAEACIHPITLAGFAQARTVSTRNDDPESASRPFDASRDGFVLGEGAGMRHPGARGPGEGPRGADLRDDRRARHHLGRHHITGTTPRASARSGDARGDEDGRVTAADIGHVNSHATSTVVGDIGEAAAIRKAVGDHAIVTAPKGSMGHLVGAAGAVEGIVTCCRVHDGIVPATMNLANLDPRVSWTWSSGEPRKVELTAAISDSFGFGGHNTALLFTQGLSQHRGGRTQKGPGFGRAPSSAPLVFGQRPAVDGVDLRPALSGDHRQDQPPLDAGLLEELGARFSCWRLVKPTSTRSDHWRRARSGRPARRVLCGPDAVPPVRLGLLRGALGCHGRSTAYCLVLMASK